MGMKRMLPNGDVPGSLPLKSAIKEQSVDVVVDGRGRVTIVVLQIWLHYFKVVISDILEIISWFTTIQHSYWFHMDLVGERCSSVCSFHPCRKLKK